MKRTPKIALLLLIGGMAAIALVAAARAPEAPRQQPNPSASSSVSDVVDVVMLYQEPTYVIKALNGVLAVYNAEDLSNPVEVTTIRVSAMRAVDQALFEKGVSVLGKENLAHFLEDFAP